MRIDMHALINFIICGAVLGFYIYYLTSSILVY
jgi:hypothetical protein